jgi:hypothetical protein
VSTTEPRTSCALCLRDSSLCDSHVKPEFIYKPLYSKNRRLVGFLTTTDGVKRKHLRKGLREKLRCPRCRGLHPFEVRATRAAVLANHNGCQHQALQEAPGPLASLSRARVAVTGPGR